MMTKWQNLINDFSKKMTGHNWRNFTPEFRQLGPAKIKSTNDTTSDSLLFCILNCNGFIIYLASLLTSVLNRSCVYLVIFKRSMQWEKHREIDSTIHCRTLFLIKTKKT